MWFFNFILLKYSCFVMLYYFLLYSKANQLYTYIYPLLGGFPSHLGHHRALNKFPCAIQSVLIIRFIHGNNSVYRLIPISQFIPPSFLCSPPHATLCTCHVLSLEWPIFQSPDVKFDHHIFTISPNSQASFPYAYSIFYYLYPSMHYTPVDTSCLFSEMTLIISLEELFIFTSPASP